MPSIPTTRSVIVVLVAIALVLGAGVATFFLGGRQQQEPQTTGEPIQLDLTTVQGSQAPAVEVVRLPWGTGPADASRKGDPVRRSTIEAVFSSEGFVFVVDHPEDVYGARVRWFSSDGQLAGARLAPGGSKNFGPYDGGYCYVIAKTVGPSETAVLADIARSSETTFVIPLQLNTGGLFASGDTLYASVAPSDVDFENETISMRFALVPVAIDGVQVDDEAADTGVAELWGFGFDGEGYSSTTRVLGLDVSSSDMITTVGSGDRSVRIPRRYRLLGATADSVVYLGTMPQEATVDRPVQAAAAWIAEREPFDEVLAVSLDGTIRANITLPYSRAAARYDGTLPVSLSEDGLYTIRADEGGVTVVRYPSQ